MKNRIVFFAIFIAACLALGATVGVYTSRYYAAEDPGKPAIEGLLWPNPRVIQPFAAVDQHNRPFGLQDLAGKWSFLFFGYTHCPDVCPVTLSMLNQVQEKLAARQEAGDVQMLFVSVDPERDTPEQIADYVKYFNQDFIGLTGSDEQIAEFTRQLGVVYFRNEETAPGEYLVDHSASVFLVSPAGQWLAIFSAPHKVDEIVNRFSAIRAFIDHQDG